MILTREQEVDVTHQLNRLRPDAPAALAKALTCLSLWLLLLTAQPAGAQEPQSQPASDAAAALATSRAAESAPAATAPVDLPAASQAADTSPAATAPVETAPSSQSAEFAPATSVPAVADASSRPTGAELAATMPADAGGVLKPFDRNARLLLNFRDASLRTVLDYLSETAGLMILDEAKMSGRVTVISRQPVSVDEAVALVDTVLKESGYAAIRNGRVLRIVTVDQAKKDIIPVRTGNDANQIDPGDQMVTQIIPIRYADAVKLKTDLASLIPASADVTSNASSNTLIITSTASTVRHIVEIVQAIDVHMSEVSQVRVFQLKFANATSAARLITDIFKEDQTGQQAGQQGGNARRNFFTQMMGGGRGGLPGMFGGAPGGGGGSNSDESGTRATKVTASADDRTNALVVSAPADVMKVIEGVVKELDSDPAEQQSVFVYHLKNADAANMQSVLNSIFGITGGSSNYSNNNRQTNTGFTGSSFGSGGGFGGTSRSNSSRGLGSMTNGNGNSNNSNNRNRGNTSTNRPSSGSGANSDLAGQVYVVADTDTNSLLVTTASKNFERVKAIIQDLDRAVPQVLIKVLIAEVTHDNSIDLGTEFSGMNLYGTQVVNGLALGNQVPNVVNSDGTQTVPLATAGRGTTGGTNFNLSAQNTGFVFSLDEKYVDAAIRAIATTSALDVLSRPYILTADNQLASIMVGQEVPIPTNQQITDTGNTINTIEYDEIGIILNVTPHINPQGLVTLDVAPQISTITGDTVPISSNLSAPVFAMRQAQCRVAIRDGQTIVIGGLMQDSSVESVDKVPFLGDIPCLGQLFQHRITKKEKTELLIFLTPHVAQQPDDLKPMTEQEQAGLKIVPKAVEKGAYQEQLEGMQRGEVLRSDSVNADSQPTQVEFDDGGNSQPNQ